jgi:hypothetical protein
MANLINIGDVWNRVLLLIGKDQYGQAFSPMKFNQSLPWADIEVLDGYIKDYEKTRILSTNLIHLFKTYGTPETPKLSVDSFGRVILPDDFYYPSSGYSSTFLNKNCQASREFNNLEFLDDATFNYRRSTKVLKPKAKYPIACYTTVFQQDLQGNEEYVPALMVAPANIKQIGLTILRRPVPAVLGYTVSNGTVIYDPTTSTQPDWPESALDDYVEALVRVISRSIHSQQDLQNSFVQQSRQGTE